MAVYTHISDDEARRHLTGYRLGALISLTGIAGGVTNTNYLLETAQGKYILTLFEERVPASDLPFFFRYMTHLRARGITVAEVVKNRSGHEVAVLSGRPSAITTFLTGEPPREISVADAAEAGALLARLHLGSQGFNATRGNAMGITAWKKLVAASGGQKEMAAELAEEIALLEKALPKNLPRGAVHADLFPDNVFFSEGKVSGVIDFYFACTDFFAYDLMLTLNAWCFGGAGLSRPRAKAFMEAYLKLRPLSAAEAQSLPLFGRAAAARIASTRLYDLLHPKPGALVNAKDPLEYVWIMRAHRDLKPQDYGLPA